MTPARVSVWVAVLSLGWTLAALGQEGPLAPPPETPVTTEPASAPSAPESAAAPAEAAEPSETEAPPEAPAAPPSRLLGRYRIGPLYLTPSFQIGTIGYDSNVSYSATDPRGDLTASAGPALKAVLPLWRSLQLEGTGTVQYSYFARTAAERRFTGNTSGGASWNGLRTGASVSFSHQRERRRPSLEVDRRVLWTSRATTATLWRTLFARTRLTVTGVRARQEIDEGEVNLGVDLRETLSERTAQAAADLDYGLTVKTSIALMAERTFHRFLFDTGRDADVDRVLAGLRTDATALISGHALAGIVQFRPRAADFARREATVWDVDATLNISPKTHIGASAGRDLAYSALSLRGAEPTLITDSFGLHLDKDLYLHLNLRVSAQRTRLSNDGQLGTELDGTRAAALLRHDTADQLNADLGYVFHTRLRIGVAAAYTTRSSNIGYFGIEGLVVGLSVQFTPPVP